MVDVSPVRQRVGSTGVSEQEDTIQFHSRRNDAEPVHCQCGEAVWQRCSAERVGAVRRMEGPGLQGWAAEKYFGCGGPDVVSEAAQLSGSALAASQPVIGRKP